VSFPAPTREWFRDWFGEEYLALYPHRDKREAEQAVNLLRRVAPVVDGPVLDLACGAGRHLRALRQAGFEAVGLDLSMTLLRSARAANPDSPVVRGDMRELPFRDASFRGVTSFFTSFGYFSDPRDDRHVVREMHRVMAPGSFFMLDFMNAQRVRRELVRTDTRAIDGGHIVQEREIIDGVVVKRIHVERDGLDTRTFEERVRLYSCSELADLLRSENLEAEHRFGDYLGSPYDHESPRLILSGRTPIGGVAAA
jgi:SAM-dependent methyltransferase